MATHFRIFPPKHQFLRNTGAIAAGDKVFIYTAGTSIKRTTFQDNAEMTGNSNPITLDSAGRLPSGCWVTTGDSKVVLAPSDDTEPPTNAYWTDDDITAINDTTTDPATEWVDSGLTPTFVSATSWTFAGDQTSIFHVGRRVNIMDSGGTDYGTIATSSYSNPTTTLTVTLDSGSIDSGISAVSYGLISHDNPSIEYLPNTSSARAKLTSTQAQAAANVFAQVNLDDDSTAPCFDLGADFDSSSGYAFVAPSAGVYSVSGWVTYDTAAATKYVEAAIYVNGSIHVKGTRYAQGAATAASAVVSGIISLSASDSVELWARTSEISGSVISSSAANTGLAIARIG